MLINHTTYSQVKKHSIIGSWVKVYVSFSNGDQLPFDHPYNQPYFRIDFTNNGKAFKTNVALDKGFMFNYTINGESLQIGFINYLINYVSKDSLIITEESNNGFDDTAIKYVFLKESNYQNQIPLKDDEFIIKESDTIYIASEKFRVSFSKNESFDVFLRKNIQEYSRIQTTDNYFLASFIINSLGNIEDIQIHKSINERFDNQFIKIVNKSSGFWKPATFNNKYINALYTVTITFSSSYTFENTYNLFRRGVIEMQRNNFDNAIYFFTKVLSFNPNDIDSLFQRGICYHKLNDLDKACIDWRIIRALGNNRTESLLSEFCN